MRMNLVKENGLEREYYFGRKRNMVSYYKYKWSKEANKYFPSASFICRLQSPETLLPSFVILELPTCKINLSSLEYI